MQLTLTHITSHYNNNNQQQPEPRKKQYIIYTNPTSSNKINKMASAVEKKIQKTKKYKNKKEPETKNLDAFVLWKILYKKRSKLNHNRRENTQNALNSLLFVVAQSKASPAGAACMKDISKIKGRSRSRSRSRSESRSRSSIYRADDTIQSNQTYQPTNQPRTASNKKNYNYLAKFVNL